MPSLSETIANLAKLRMTAPAGMAREGHGRLSELSSFGANPGALRGWAHVPDDLPPRSALVVVLHGCTQTAAAYDAGAGWSEMADRHGFALLFPEQQRANNPNLCFNWFAPDDHRRDAGEALSIRQMVAAMVDRHALDPSRVFVTGLSAGGAMASVMLAAYPDVFAGGAIIAGLPYACATSVPQALERMRGHGMPDAARLAGLIRGASSHDGPWPTLSIWHGSGDATVNPVNADAIVGQWAMLHGVDVDADRIEAVDGYPRRVWSDARGRDVIEAYSITGMAHGTPIDPSGEDGCGKRGAFMLEAGISSTHHLCRFWGLTGPAGEARDAPRASRLPSRKVEAARHRQTEKAPADAFPKGGVAAVIEDALRAAGLMR